MRIVNRTCWAFVAYNRLACWCLIRRRLHWSWVKDGRCIWSLGGLTSPKCWPYPTQPRFGCGAPMFKAKMCSTQGRWVAKKTVVLQICTFLLQVLFFCQCKWRLATDFTTAFGQNLCSTNWMAFRFEREATCCNQFSRNLALAAGCLWPG